VVAVVGLVRFIPAPGDFENNTVTILEQARAAARLGAAVVVFPLSALSGVSPLTPTDADGLDGVEQRTDQALTKLAQAAEKAGLGGRYLLVGTRGHLAGGAPQLETALAHKGKIALRYAAGRPDPLATPWAAEHRVAGELALPGPLGRCPAFQAHGVRFGIELAGSGVAARWPADPGTTLDAVLHQRVGGAFVADQAGRRLNRDQPSHDGLTLWHTTD
jgi:predicted amidohydrolase